MKAKGGEHFRKSCGMQNCGMVSNAEGIELNVIVSKRRMTFRRAVSFKVRGLKSDFLTLLGEWEEKN